VSKSAVVGASFFGDLPDLPPEIEWPVHKGKPLAFLAQLNMTHIAEYDKQGLLPKTGMLYFFYDAEGFVWGGKPDDRGGWRVIYYDGGVPQLVQAKPPAGLGADFIFKPCRLEFMEWSTLPAWDSDESSWLDLDDEESDAYAEMLDELYGGLGTQHWLLGHPNNIQGDMRTSCEMLSQGKKPGPYESAGDFLAETLKYHESAMKWVLLFQLDTDDDAGMMWGDCGRLYFWIREEDLKNRRFENVWMQLQCY
jgi:uncharacterized protein YwqG